MEKFTVPAVGAIVISNKEDKLYVLLQERNNRDTPKENGLLELPAGKIREYEDIYKAFKKVCKIMCKRSIIYIRRRILFF